MANVDETAVAVDVSLTRNGPDVRVVVSGSTLCTIEGVQYSVRELRDQDVTAIVPPELVPHIMTLLDAAEAYVKGTFNIP